MGLTLQEKTNLVCDHFFAKARLAQCGHKTYLEDKVKAFSKTGILKLLPENGKLEYCHKCLEKMSIQCVECGEAIFVGSEYALVETKDLKKSKKIPPHAHKITIMHEGEEKEVYLACIKNACSDKRYGILLPNQEIKGFPEEMDWRV